MPSLMKILSQKERERKDKIADALCKEFVGDVQKRFDFLSSLNTKAIQAYESDASLREGFLKDVEKNSPDFPAVVLEKLYKDNPEKQAELAECFKTKDRL